MHDSSVPKIIVNDGYVDLRDKNFDEPCEYSFSAKFLKQKQGNKSELRSTDQKLLSDGFRSTTTSSKEKTLNKRKVTNRGDPRFRKKRSPDRRSNISQSATTLLSGTMYTALTRPLSTSTPHFKKSAFRTNSDKESNVIAFSKRNTPRMLTELSESEIKENRSNDSKTLDNSDTKDLDLDLPQVSPYWNDDRLLAKYSGIFNVANVKRSKSNWTLPISRSDTLLVQEKCPCIDKTQNEPYNAGNNEYLSPTFIDNRMITKDGLVYMEGPQTSTILQFILGSIIAIVIFIAIVIILYEKQMINSLYLLRSTKTEPIASGGFFSNLFYNVYNWITNFASAISHLLKLIIFTQRKEVYETAATETTWYNYYMK